MASLRALRLCAFARDTFFDCHSANEYASRLNDKLALLAQVIFHQFNLTGTGIIDIRINRIVQAHITALVINLI